MHLLVCYLNKDLSLIVPYTEVSLLLINRRYEWAISGFRREVDGTEHFWVTTQRLVIS